MNIQGVLFDFDGIVADTERLHYLAFQEVFERLGLGFSWEVYVEVYMGFDDRGVFKHLFNEHDLELTDLSMGKMIAEKGLWFEGQAKAGGIPLFPGVEALIAEAAARGPVGLCSGALRSDVAPIFDEYGLWKYFEFMVTAEDVEESKPHPASYLLALERLQAVAGGAEALPSSSVIAIEDTPAGIHSAGGAGLYTVGIGHTYPVAALAVASLVFDSFDGVTFERMEKELNER